MTKVNNQDKTLEQLENEVWDQPNYPSHLVMTVHALRKKPLKDFNTENLRIVIGQSFSLEHLIPLAIERLKENVLAEGDMYEGDLLANVLESDANYWKTHKDNWELVKELVEQNKKKVEASGMYKRIKKSFEHFEIINK